ncbi:MAG: acyltransferase [Desulfobacteraceae bacterium]|nr:acyltransferase [Desulfobacteraceae bacterium]
MNRNKRILALNGLGICLVVIGHSQGVLPTVQASIAERNHLYGIFLFFIEIVYTFHMSLFFFVSGFLYFYSGSNFKTSWFDFLSKKFKRLIVPYLIISSITYPIKVAMSQYALRPMELGIYDYFLSIFSPWNNTIVFFWFLPTLFLMMLFARLSFCAETSIIKDSFIFSSSMLAYFYFGHRNVSGWESFLNVGGAMHNLIYFVVGALLCKYRNSIILKPNNILLFLPFSVLLLCYIYFPSVRINQFFMINMAFSGIILCCFIANCFWPTFQFIGIHSYQIYLLSWFPQVFVRVVFGQIIFINVWLSVLLSFILGLLIPITIVKIIKKRRHNGLYLLLGM